MHGGQISDWDCKQIDEGVKEKYPESEITRTVLKIIKLGTFKDMLINKEDLSLAELKMFLHSHLQDQSSTDLFQELINGKQQDKSTPQQFVYRIMGLKQKVLWSSQQVGAAIVYDKDLIQGVFLHMLYQGLSETYSDIRRDIQPYISDLSVTDDSILEKVALLDSN